MAARYAGILLQLPIIRAQELHSRSKANINYRQDGLQTTPAADAPPQLPSNFWWPFPQTTQATAPPAVAATVTLEQQGLVSSTQSIDSPARSETTSLPAPMSSSMPSSSIISISALPPANSSLGQTYPKLSSTEGHSNMKIILPVCIVVGVVLGAIVSWFICGCVKRRPRRTNQTYTGLSTGKVMNFDGTTYAPNGPEKPRWGGGRRRRESELEVGPQYIALEDEDEKEAVHQQEPMPSDQMTSSSQSDASPAAFAWPSIAAVMTPSKNTQRNVLSRASTTATKSSRKTTGQPASPAETDITSFLSPVPDVSRHPSRLHAPWESLRHKSIKRGILEQVQKSEVVRTRRASGVAPIAQSFVKSKRVLSDPDDGVSSDEDSSGGLLRRQGHTRAHSDMHLDPLPFETPVVMRSSQDGDQNYSFSSSDSPIRNSPPSRATPQSTTKGFRMFAESPPNSSSSTKNPSLPLRSRPRGQRDPPEAPEASDGSISRALAWASSAFLTTECDKFTPIPERRSQSPSKQRGQDNILDDEFVRSNYRPSRSMFRSVLPQSPSIAPGSPLEESQLCFSPSLTGHAISIAGTRAVVTPISPPLANRLRTIQPKNPATRKLRSRSPTRLPFPSGKVVLGDDSPRPGVVDAADVYRGRLTKKDPRIGKMLPVFSSEVEVGNSDVHDRVKEIIGRR